MRTGILNCFLVICVFLSITSGLFAQPQEKTITGKVVLNDLSEPAVGAVVQEKGTNNASATSTGGQFSLKVSNTPATLVVSYMGYKTQEVVVKGGSVEVVLEEDSQSLDEVVVVAYGTMKKSDLTGSVASVSAEEINSMPVSSLDKALQGRVPGVSVKTASASPGGSMEVVIRGGNSLMSGLDPLYVIDGFPVDKSYMNSFSPDDVASIEVLKDASATALYGSRASNGVVLITTKKGRKGRTKVEYSNYFNFQFVPKDLNLLNGSEFAMIYNEYLENTGLDPVYVGDNRYFPAPEEIGEGTNWFDQITRMGFAQNHQLTVSGGSDKVNYMLSANYNNHEGVIIGGDFNRIALRSNTDYKVNKWLTISNNFSFGRTDRSGSGDNTDFATTNGTIANMIKMSPALPVYDINGNYMQNNFPGANSLENPVAIAKELSKSNVIDNMIENLSIVITPYKGVTFTSRLGVNVKNNRSDNYTPRTTVSGSNTNGSASISVGSYTSIINENILTYDSDFRDKRHRLNLMAGYSIQKEVNRTAGLSASNFPSDFFLTNNMGAATEHDPGSSWKTASQLVSYLGRINYVFDDRYLLTLTGRADGSSRFAEGHKWGFFPSAAVAWNMKNESFLKDVGPISNLKLRLSWGMTGNQNIGLYKSMSLLAINKYVFGNSVVNGIASSVLADPELKWETTSQYNVGIDYGMFNNRLSVTAEYYYKVTNDLLLNQTIPSTSGYSQILTNVGKLQNQGFEFGIRGVALDRNGFRLMLSGSLSLNRNKLLEVNTENGELWMDDIFMKEGYPIGLFRGQDFMGIFKSQQEIDEYVHPETGQKIMPGAKPGDVKYRDVNNDGKISGEDWVILGNSNPDFIWNFGGDFEYKNVMLSFLFIGSQGNSIRNKTKAYYTQVSTMRSNLSRDVLDRWHETKNPDGNFMRLGGTGTMPNVEDGSFVKLQNIRLSYRFRLPKLGIEEIDLFVSAQNVFTITDYSGFDPDINTMSDSNVNFGTDNAAFPNPKVLSAGFSIKF